MGKIMKKLGLYVVCATVAIVIPMSVVATDLETITVVGSRTERPLKEIAATIDVIDSIKPTIACAEAYLFGSEANAVFTN